MLIFHASFVEHFPVELFGVGVDFQVVIALCGFLLQRNFVDFSFRIVIIVERLEGRCGVEVIYVSAGKSFAGKNWEIQFNCDFGKIFSRENCSQLTSINNKQKKNAQKLNNQTKKHFHVVTRWFAGRKLATNLINNTSGS